MDGAPSAVAPVVDARIRPPSQKRALVSRDRLLGLLREGSKLTLIHAPAGYGKTTLAAQWAAELARDGASVAWLSVDAEDNNPSWFLAHLIAAVQRARPGIAAGLGDVLQQLGSGGERYVLSTLVNQIDEDAAPLAIVIDDWHRVTDSDAEAALRFLVEYGPDNLRVVVASRTTARLPLSQLRVRSQLTEVDAARLRFDVAEAQSFLVDVEGLELAGRDIADLTESTDGWAAALQLASLSLRGNVDAAGLAGRIAAGHHAIGEFLAENVLDALEPELLDFLLATSIPERICGELANALAGVPNGHAMLREAERRDLFLVRLDDRDVWYRYHHLFAGFLRQRLERDAPHRIEHLHATASAWFESQAMVPDAVTHALAGGQVERAVKIVEHEAMVLVEHSQMTTLLGLAEQLPPAAAQASPPLMVALAWANSLLRRPVPAQVAIDHLRETVAAAGPSTGEMDALLAEADLVQGVVDAYLDRIDRAEDLVRAGLEQPDRFRPFFVTSAANVQAFVDIQSFRFQDARNRLRWAHPYRDKDQGPFAGVYTRCLDGIAAFALLDLDVAEQRFTDAVTIARRGAGRESHAAQLSGALLGAVRYERGDIDAAEEFVRESHQLGAEGGIVDFMLATFGVLARIRALRGAQAEAFELLTAGLKVAERLRLPRLAASLVVEQVRLHVLAGRPREAQRALANLPEPVSDEGGIGVQVELARTAAAALTASCVGDHAAAVSQLTRLVDRSVELRHPRAELAARVQLSAALERAGRHHQATRALAFALPAAARAGARRSVLDGGPPVLTALGRLRDAAHEGRWPADIPTVPADYLAALLASEPDSVNASPRELSSTLRALSARELDVLRLTMAGLSNAEMAARLSVTVNTVKWYLKNIYAKLGVDSRAECVLAARDGGLVG